MNGAREAYSAIQDAIEAAIEKAAAEDRPSAYLVRQFVREALKAKGFLK